LLIYWTVTIYLPWRIDAMPSGLIVDSRPPRTARIQLAMLIGKLVLEALAPYAQARNFLGRKEEPTHFVSAKMPPCQTDPISTRIEFESFGNVGRVPSVASSISSEGAAST
jgi:hypothetical protein